MLIKCIKAKHNASAVLEKNDDFCWEKRSNNYLIKLEALNA